MEKGFSRIQRVSQEIQRAIAVIFNRDIKDPRVRMLTVSGVEVTRDLHYAKVFVTFLNILNQEEKDIVKSGIKLLNGKIRKRLRFLLAKKIRLRVVPELFFFMITP